MSPAQSLKDDLRVGNDLVYISRLQKSWNRHGDAFFLRLLTPAEWAYCQQGHPKLCLPRAAGRIAVKEATAKALGCGLNGLGWAGGVNWHDIEVLSAEKSAPELQLTGQAQFWQEKLGISHWRISFSHDGDYAFATVIGVVQALN